MCTNHTNFSVERLLSDISSHSQQLKFLSECGDCNLKESNDSNEADFKHHGNSMSLNQSRQSVVPVQCENSDAVQVKRPLPMRPNPITIGIRIDTPFEVTSYENGFHGAPKHSAADESCSVFHECVINSVHQHSKAFKLGETECSRKGKRSWSRAVFSNLQKKGLERTFQKQKYITNPDRKRLAANLGLHDSQVKVWFQNRRMKWRKTIKPSSKQVSIEVHNETGSQSCEDSSNEVDSDDEVIID